jgi:hypothetical protein
MSRSWVGLVVLVALLGGCKKLPEQQGAVLEGFRYGWQLANHRLSALHVVAGQEETEVAVVGGTSTTSELPELPPGCEQATCNEFPIADTSQVQVWWSEVTTTESALVPLQVTMEVGRDGAETVARGALPKGSRGEGTALLVGLSLGTDHPLEGEPGCYQPRYGWHVRQLAVSLGEVTLEEESVSVPVQATFSAGKSFEEARTCVDEVNDRAVVDLDVHLLVVVGKGDHESATLTAEAAYPFSGDAGQPEEQPEVEPQTLSFAVEEPLLGFGSLDFRFDPDQTDDGGAYLRTLGFWVTEEGGTVQANAVATNYSPGTQLSDFAYHFEGEVHAVETGGTIERGTSQATLATELDEAGDAVIHTVEH